MKTGKTDEPDPRLWPKAAARVEPLEFRRAPVLVAACWFALGEVLAHNWQPPVVLLVALAVLLGLTAVALRVSVRVAVVPLAGVWMVVGLWCAQVRPVPSTQQALLSYADGLSRQVRGRVVRVRELPATAKTSDSDSDKEVGWWEGKEEAEAEAAVGAVSVDVQVEEVEEVTPDVAWMTPVSGGVRMNVIADKVRRGGVSAAGIEPTSASAGHGAPGFVALPA
ncbi:MAG: competence protein ComEC, partial [Edaphobacter sp.]